MRSEIRFVFGVNTKIRVQISVLVELITKFEFDFPHRCFFLQIRIRFVAACSPTNGTKQSKPLRCDMVRRAQPHVSEKST